MRVPLENIHFARSKSLMSLNKSEVVKHITLHLRGNLHELIQFIHLFHSCYRDDFQRVSCNVILEAKGRFC